MNMLMHGFPDERIEKGDTILDISDCGDKVRRLIEEAVVADGVEILVKRVSIFSGDFENKLEAMKSDEAKASEMEHALRHEIHVHLEEDPAFYQSLRERLEQIIEDRKAQRIDAARQLELFQVVVDRMRGRAQAAEDVGLSETGFAMYGLLSQGGGESEARKELAELLEEVVAPQTQIVDWVRKDDVQRDMRRLMKRQLKAAGYPDGEIERLLRALIDLLKVRKGR
jgi:type I restriction enzyme, R subunit